MDDRRSLVANEKREKYQREQEDIQAVPGVNAQCASAANDTLLLALCDCRQHGGRPDGLLSVHHIYDRFQTYTHHMMCDPDTPGPKIKVI